MKHSAKYKRTLYSVAELIVAGANNAWAAAEAALRAVPNNVAFANVIRGEQGWPIEFPSHLVRSGVGARFDLHLQYALEAVLARDSEKAPIEICAMADMICVPGFSWGE